MDYEVECIRPRGRLKKTYYYWKRLSDSTICKKDAMDREKWRKLIKDVV